MKQELRYKMFANSPDGLAITVNEATETAEVRPVMNGLYGKVTTENIQTDQEGEHYVMYGSSAIYLSKCKPNERN